MWSSNDGTLSLLSEAVVARCLASLPNLKTAAQVPNEAMPLKLDEVLKEA